MDIFEGIEIPASAQAAAEAEIARVISDNPQMHRYDACRRLADSLASIIAEDVIRGRDQWQPRLDRYVHLNRLAEAEITRISAVLAEHTAAACDTITKASATC